MNPRKFAVPVSYGDPRTGIGSVNIVASEGPPLSIRPWTTADGEDKHIAIELEDITKTVERINGLKDSEVMMRLCLHLADARKLTHNLISRLAESGDPMAKRLQEHVNDSMEIVRALDNAPIALCKLNLTSLDYASFELTWDGKTHTHTHFQNKLQMDGEKWHVPLDAPTQNPITFAMERLRQKEHVYAILRIIRKYAEVLGLLLRMQDNSDILRGINYKSLLHPYNAPEPIVPMTLANCRVYCKGVEYRTPTFGPDTDDLAFPIIHIDVDGPLINIKATKQELAMELFKLASVASKQNLLVKFIDPGHLLANHNLPNIFGKNLCGV